jgi:DNA-binding response OmpR family regulator
MTISPVRPPRRAALKRRSPQPYGRVRTSSLQKPAFDHTRSIAVHVHIVVDSASPTELERQIATGLRLAAKRLTDDRSTVAPKPIQPKNIETLEPLLQPGIVISSGLRQVWSGGKAVAITAKEFELLLFLARHPDRFWTRDALMSRLWSSNYYSGRTVDVHVHRLRAKLSDDVILTSRQVGYRINPAAQISIVDPIDEPQ